MNILITGGTGFLGTNIIKRLSSSNNIFCLVRNSSNVSKLKKIQNINFLKVEDLKNDSFFKTNKIEIIIHCATCYGRKNETKNEINEINIELPKKLIEYANYNYIKYFINTDTALNKNVSYYSNTKKMFLEWAKKNSKNTRIINVVSEHFYGPGDDSSKFISYILSELAKNLKTKLPLTKGIQKRDFIYIDDVVDAYETILNNLTYFNESFANVGVASNSLISIKDLVELAKDLSSNTNTILDFGAIPLRENEIIESKNNTKVLESLGWSIKNSIKEGLKKTINAL